MTTIIAECCQNHKGDLGILHDMIWTAAEAGADYVKIQSMLADELVQRERFEVATENWGVKRWVRPYQAEYDRLKPMDLDDDAHVWFVEECRRAGIKPLTTIFTHSRIPFLGNLDWDAVKVASYDCASYPLLESLNAKFKHLFISTGATHNHEIEKTVKMLKGHSFTLLYCVCVYPTPLEAIQLPQIDYLRHLDYPNRLKHPVGFSDHTLVTRDGLQASLAALFFGVDVIERHFTILPEDETKDGPISIGPEMLKELVALARLSENNIHAFIHYCQREVPNLCLMSSGHHEFDEDMFAAFRRGESVKSKKPHDREIGELSPEELLNRDYYRGRFAGFLHGKQIQNWEEWNETE